MVKGFFKAVLLLLCVVYIQTFAGYVSYSALAKTPPKFKKINEYGVAVFQAPLRFEGNMK